MRIRRPVVRPPVVKGGGEPAAAVQNKPSSQEHLADVRQVITRGRTIGVNPGLGREVVMRKPPQEAVFLVVLQKVTSAFHEYEVEGPMVGRLGIGSLDELEDLGALPWLHTRGGRPANVTDSVEKISRVLPDRGHGHILSTFGFDVDSQT
jgi:hypothetical protein